MREVGVFEAKNKLSALIDTVGRGEEIVITRHGKPVARLVAPERRDVAKAREAAAWIRQNRVNNSLGDLTLKELIEEGRK